MPCRNSDAIILPFLPGGVLVASLPVDPGDDGGRGDGLVEGGELCEDVRGLLGTHGRPENRVKMLCGALN